MKRFVILLLPLVFLFSVVGCAVVIEEESFGVTLSAKDVTPTSLTMVFSHSGEQIEEESLVYGSEYTIEVYKDGKWEALPYLPSEYERAWTAIAYLIPQNGSSEQTVSWEMLYGTLETGRYRVVKEIMYTPRGGKQSTHLYYAEFEIG